MSELLMRSLTTKGNSNTSNTKLREHLNSCETLTRCKHLIGERQSEKSKTWLSFHQSTLRIITSYDDTKIKLVTYNLRYDTQRLKL